MDNTHLTLRLMSWLRKRGVTNFDLFRVTCFDNNVSEITDWNYENIPQPDISTVPNLSDEELFQEYEDFSNFSFSADIYIVSADGTVRADRRQSLWRLEGNEIVLSMGRYYIHPEPTIDLWVNGNVANPVVEVISGETRVSVTPPSVGEAIVLVWKVWVKWVLFLLAQNSY